MTKKTEIEQGKDSSSPITIIGPSLPLMEVYIAPPPLVAMTGSEGETIFTLSIEDDELKGKLYSGKMDEVARQFLKTVCDFAHIVEVVKPVNEPIKA